MASVRLSSDGRLSARNARVRSIEGIVAVRSRVTRRRNSASLQIGEACDANFGRAASIRRSISFANSPGLSAAGSDGAACETATSKIKLRRAARMETPEGCA